MAFSSENATISPFSRNNPMKQNLFLLTVMIFALSSVLSAAEPVIKRPFNGTNLDGWNIRAGSNVNCWTVGTFEANAMTLEAQPLRAGARGYMLNNLGADWRDARPRRGIDIYTEEKFGDCTIKLEFLITRGSNSGVYLMGEYEVQIHDSFGKADDTLHQGDMGAIYSAAAPSTNAAKEPGVWQTMEIEFVAPRFDAQGNKIASALFKRVVLNGVLIQENIEVRAPTGGGLTMREAATGPLMFQGTHGPVAFRNIEVIVPQGE